MNEGKFEIVVSYHWTHPHYGGDRKSEWRFKMSEGEQAEAKMNELDTNRNGSTEYCHATIEVRRIVREIKP